MAEPACDLEGRNAQRLARKALQALAQRELVILRHVGGGLSARPWGAAERFEGPPCSAGPGGPAGPQIKQLAKVGGCEDQGDQRDQAYKEDPPDLFDRLQDQADQLLLEGMG